MTVLLAIETSQREGGVALRDAAGRISARRFRAGARRDDALMPAVDAVFCEADIDQRELEGVAVSIGPGGFTGLRIAITTAKMLAETLGAKIAAVPSALVAAETAREEHELSGDLLVALAVKRGAFWATTVRLEDDDWRLLREPRLVEAEAVGVEGIRYVIGDRYLPDVLRARSAGVGAAVLPLRMDPVACLRVGGRMLTRGDVTDALALAPLYARAPEAVSLWNARRRIR